MDLFVSDNVLKIFEKEIKEDLSLSFLFYGEKGLGVFYAAKVFAKSLLCEKKVLGGCGKCYFCTESDKKYYDEILILENNEDSIKIDEVKNMAKKLLFKPQHGCKKILIINEAEKLTTEAQSALLKVVEEPKKDLVIILVSSDKEAMLDTILSRVISINFFKRDKEETIKFLEARILKDSDFILFCVEYFNNMVADCTNYLKDDRLFDKELENIVEFIKLYNGSFYEATLYIKKLSDFKDDIISSREHLEELVRSWIRFLEFNVKKESGFSSSDFFEKNNIILNVSLDKKIILLNSLKNVYESLEESYLNKRLLFETLFLGRMFKK